MTLPVPADVLSKLKSVLGPDGWSVDPDRLAPKLVEWRGRWRGETPLLALPRTTEEVAAVVGICFEHGVAITPQGGNTGLVGGQIPEGEILLSTERLRRVRDVAPIDDCIVVEAGVTLLETQQAAAEAGRFFPLSLAAEGTATIGGNISTNAGGTAVLRYGVMRDLVLGLEAVLPNGEVFQGLKRLRKDNTGYDLKQLLIGAEGTLGVITAASLKLFPVMVSRATAVVGLASPQAAVDLLVRAKAETGGGVEAFELMGRRGVENVLKNIPDTREMLSEPHPWYVLIELTSGEPGAAEAGMERLLAAAFEEGLIADAALAQNEAQAKAFWRVREDQSAGQKPEGAAWKHDVSVPLSRIADFIVEATAAAERFHPGARVVAFGHVGDGNVHFDVLQPVGADGAAFSALRDEGSKIIHDLVAAYDGSISAEHGLGRMKSAEALRYKSPVQVEAMRAIRAALDPKRIMNPRVLF
ncbi:FAD-binding oxidoreductase [Caulobacter sp. 17J80-11]|uniref:FAD-binding oxidoreductase n=1 Tax=Caulobacter sp. 17J80-11 TaxID=2763502 RepID=UPI0016537737|nr:FAD-binding oxidoreductase [Caulobacter sp. 17J80-11]MBC6983062.1 FAD-binding oxidoreductase [Caulobacter sp. 17J80-11]